LKMLSLPHKGTNIVKHYEQISKSPNGSDVDIITEAILI